VNILEETAPALVEIAAQSAFGLFNEKQFRDLAHFAQLSQVEQDRIFNELLTAFLVLTMLLLEAPDLNVDDNGRARLRRIAKSTPTTHLKYLESLGLEAAHVQDWGKLLGMRYEEYAHDRHDVRAAAMQLSSAEKQLDLDELSKIQLLVPVQSVAIGCHAHVCRGETKGNDELFKLVLKSLSRFYFELRFKLEGRRITPLTRTKLLARKFLHRFVRK